MARRRGRDGQSQGILPLRRRSFSFTHTISCWYCDFKTTILNEKLYSLGHKHSKFLQSWFTMGIGVTFLAIFGVILILTWESSRLVVSHEERISLIEKSKQSLYTALPTVPGLDVPLRDVGYLVTGTVLSVGFHEFGHALAAASEGVQIEYVAVFLALLLPGAFVAINFDRLELLSCAQALRIYCAGVWHNAVCCVVCWFTLALLPGLLHGMYTHGESLVVLNVPRTSSLAGYLSPGDIILEIDNNKVSNPEEWLDRLNLMHLRASEENNMLDDIHATNKVDTKQNIHMNSLERGFCVPNAWLRESQQLKATNNSLSCLTGNIPFIKISCLNNSDVEENKNFTAVLSQENICLRAKDVVQLKKCGSGWSQPLTSDICPCSESELCMNPRLLSGLMLIEITYMKANAPECLSAQMEGNIRNFPSDYGVQNDQTKSFCQSSLLFVGDALSLALSVELTGYKSRRSILFSIASPLWLPNMLEKLLMYTFHISAGLALLNSAPVYYLDGESILESIVSLLVLHKRQMRRILSVFLMSGTLLLLLSILSGVRTFFY